MTPLAGTAARGRIRLYAMLTPSLEAWYALDAVVPSVRAVMLGLDEAGRTTGIATACTVYGGLRTARVLACVSQRGLVFLTMGEAGMLATDPANDCVRHVRLCERAAARVRALVDRVPESRCGCGGWARAASLPKWGPGIRRWSVRPAVCPGRCGPRWRARPPRSGASAFASRWPWTISSRPPGRCAGAAMARRPELQPK
jgi:hypothetical protein